MSNSFLASGWDRLTRIWQQWSVLNRGSFLITIPMISLVSFTVLQFQAKQSVHEAEVWIDHTQTVISGSNRLQLDLVSFEAAVRGYYIVHSDQISAEYARSIREISKELAELKLLVQDNPQQSARLRQIQDTVERKLRVLAYNTQTDRLLDNAEPSTATALLNSRESTIKDVRNQINTFEAEEQRLLAERRNRLEYQQNWGNVAVWLGAAVGLLSSLVALYLFRNLESSLRQRKGELIEHQELVAAIADNIIDGVIALNEAGYIRSVNTAAAEMFKVPQDELVGQFIGQLIPEVADSQNPPTPHLFNESLEMRQGQRIQTMGLRRDGNFFPMDLSISQIQEDGEWLVLVQDITERQQAEAKLESRANELAQLAEVLAETNTDLSAKNRELSQFAYVASHDLKAPLRAISNLSAWIEEDLGLHVSPDTQEQFKLMRGRVQRMEALITGLLEYSRVGGTDEMPEAVSTHNLLQDVIRSVPIPENFEVIIDPNMPTFVARRLRLSQVFINLISNAVKHHDRSDGTVKISVRALDQFYEFAVIDDGPGIAPAYHSKVFTIFQTLQPRDKAENTGVGLSIVKKMVEIEGGTVQIHSGVSQGSTFFFTWPKQPALPKAERQRGITSAPDNR